jgi:hypothetical protein
MGARRPSGSEAGGCPGVASGGPSFCPWIGQKLIRQIPAGFQSSAYLSLTQIRRLNQGPRRSLASEAAQAPRGRAIPKGSSIRMQDPAPRTLHPVHQESRVRVLPGPDARPGWDDCGTVVGPGSRALGRTPRRAGRRPAAKECRRHLHRERTNYQGPAPPPFLASQLAGSGPSSGLAVGLIRDPWRGSAGPQTSLMRLRRTIGSIAGVPTKSPVTSVTGWEADAA